MITNIISRPKYLTHSTNTVFENRSKKLYRSIDEITVADYTEFARV